MKISRKLISLMLVLVLFLSVMPVNASAKGDIMYGIGFTTGTGLRLRSEPSTASRVIDSAPKGEVVVVVSKVGEWYKVIYNLQEGYMHSDYVSVLTKENAELGYGKVNGTYVNLRSGPSTSHKSVGMANTGDKVYIIGLNTGWYKVIWGSQICYIRSDFVDLTEIPYENQDSAKSPLFFRDGKTTGVAPSAAALNGGNTSNNSGSDNTNSSTNTGSNTGNTGNTESNTGNTGSTPAPSALGPQIVALAEQQLGIPYVWGEEHPSKGFDCSGLVYYVLKELGLSPYRTPADLYRQGTYVAKEDLQPGDIVFFQNTYKSGISHVGIYVGDGKFIHAPNSRSVVSYADLNSTYYTQHYYGARRMG